MVATVEVTKNSPTSVFCLPMTEDSSNSSNSNAFNYFFTTIGPLLANTIPTSSINPLSYVKNVSNSIVIEDLSERDVSNIIK